jgi:hypothetical protein
MTQSNSEVKLAAILEKLALGSLFLIVGWQYNAQQKMEDRMYTMQGQMFTEEKAKVLEDRLTKSVEAIRADVNGRLDILISLQSPYGRQMKQ